MRLILIFICFMFCSCATSPRVVQPIKLESYKNYKTPDSLAGDSSEKKTKQR